LKRMGQSFCGEERPRLNKNKKMIKQFSLILLLLILSTTSKAFKVLPDKTCTTSTTIDNHLNTIFNLERSLNYQILISSDDQHNFSVTPSSLRIQIASAYESLALVYINASTTTYPHSNDYAVISKEAANYILEKQHSFITNYNHLRYNILPFGHESNPKLLSDLGRVSHQLGNLKESEEYYKRSINIDGLACNNIVHVYTESEQWNKSIEYLNKAIHRKINDKCIPRYGWKEDWLMKNEGAVNKKVDVRTLPDQQSYVITLYNVSMTGQSGAMFHYHQDESQQSSASSSTAKCEIYLGGHRFMHRLR
jgi:tetratricopeptide (TPR) repeat protein